MKSAVGLRFSCAKAKFTATFWSQVLAQLHGVPAEEDEQDEQQEDAQGAAGSQEHRRPRSAGHLTEPSSSTSTHKIGRPPLAETTANNKLGLKVPVHCVVISWSAVYWLEPLLDLTGAYVHLGISCTNMHAGAANAVRCHPHLPQVIWCYIIRFVGLFLVAGAFGGRNLGGFAYALHENLKHAVQSAY